MALGPWGAAGAGGVVTAVLLRSLDAESGRERIRPLHLSSLIFLNLRANPPAAS